VLNTLFINFCKVTGAVDNPNGIRKQRSFHVGINYLQSHNFVVTQFRYISSVDIDDSGSVAEWSEQKGPVLIVVSTLSGSSCWQTVHTHCASVHQAAKLLAALFRVARVTAGLAESDGSRKPTVGFMTHVTCRLTTITGIRGNRVWATFTCTFRR